MASPLPADGSWKETDVPGRTMPVCPIDPKLRVAQSLPSCDTQGSGYVLITLLPQFNLRGSRFVFKSIVKIKGEKPGKWVERCWAHHRGHPSAATTHLFLYFWGSKTILGVGSQTGGSKHC